MVEIVIKVLSKNLVLMTSDCKHSIISYNKLPTGDRTNGQRKTILVSKICHITIKITQVSANKRLSRSFPENLPITWKIYLGYISHFWKYRFGNYCFLRKENKSKKSPNNSISRSLENKVRCS